LSYFAAAVAKGPDGWSAAEVSLADTADLEDVADRLRDVSPAAEVSLLFVESDDAYLAILRLDNGEDLRVFASDVAFAEDSRLGALLLSDLTEPMAELAAEIEPTPTPPGKADAAGLYDASEPDVAELSDVQDDEAILVPTTLADAEPVGDADLLADLGVAPAKLIALCAQEGMLPSDITAEVCQALGCGDEVEELREA
jgi:putative tRNA adenosine deaminase-associated protein